METKICTKCGKVKPINEFRLRNDQPGKRHSHCKECVVKQVSERRRETKFKCIEYKGGKCSVCGYDKCSAALEFHHLDPSKKEFNINKSATLSFKKLKPELDKCILVCSNCHREIHNKE